MFARRRTPPPLPRPLDLTGIAALCCFSLIYTGCDQGPSVDGRTDDDLLADLEAILEDGVDTWNQAPEWEGIQWNTPGSPHLSWVDIRQDPVAASGMSEGVAPYGSVLVKQVHGRQDGTEPRGRFAMWRLRDAAPERDDWFWAAWEPGGTPAVYGRGIMDCWNCHSSGATAVRSWIDGPGVPIEGRP